MSSPDHDATGIDVSVGLSQPDCPRCGQQALMSARVPHGWERDNGQRTNGTTVVALCSTCDAHDPACGPLITFFHVHEHVTANELPECADLIRLWVDNIKIRKLDIATLDAEVEAWRRGDL